MEIKHPLLIHKLKVLFVAKLQKETYTPRDLELLKGITNADYHYKGSGKIMAQIGKAFAEANFDLLKD